MTTALLRHSQPHPSTITVSVTVNINADRTLLFLTAVIWSLWWIPANLGRATAGQVADLVLAVGGCYVDFASFVLEAVLSIFIFQGSFDRLPG
jgi:hypothetical protein